MPNGMLIPVVVHDPLMKEIKAHYGVFDAHMAVVEMAQASGLTLVDDDKRNPLYTSSIGIGELIRAALRVKEQRNLNSVPLRIYYRLNNFLKVHGTNVVNLRKNHNILYIVYIKKHKI